MMNPCLLTKCNKANCDTTKKLSGCLRSPYQTNNAIYECFTGEIVVGIKDNVCIESTFELFNQYDNLLIDEVNRFFYSSTYLLANKESLNDFLNTKLYICTRGRSATVSLNNRTGLLDIKMTFFSMNKINQRDWIDSKTKLQLVDTNDSAKYILLKVPAGQEAYWIKTLSSSSLVKYAEEYKLDTFYLKTKSYSYENRYSQPGNIVGDHHNIC